MQRLGEKETASLTLRTGIVPDVKQLLLDLPANLLTNNIPHVKIIGTTQCSTV